MAVERVRTGIAGLDSAMKGGFPRGSVTLLSGGPGTGKTTLAMQYIYQGAKNNEPGVYITFEQEPEDLTETANQFGMDFQKLEKEGKVKVLRIRNAKDYSKVLKTVEANVMKINARRLVFDSLSSIEIFASTFSSISKDIPPQVLAEKFSIMPPANMIIRRLMYKIIDSFKEMKVTTLLTSESQNSEFSRHGIAEFVTDGIIAMNYLGMGNQNFRSLKIVKMRKTKHEEDFIPFTFGKKGIELSKKDTFKV